MINWIRAKIPDALHFIDGFTGTPIHGLCHGKVFLQSDGTTDLSRVLGACVVLAFLAYQAFALVALHQIFDASAFGTGAAAMCAGVGVFILAHDHARQ